MTRLVVATHNRGKVAELRDALQGAGFEIDCLAQAAPQLEIEEDGETFAANALKKALGVSTRLACLAVADDSGLVVDALDGAPGVHSARFGGPGLTDAQRCHRLLASMLDIPDERRTARFQCVLALSGPQLDPVLFHGTLEGSISRSLAGEHGFGYDPVFIPAGHNQSLAILGPALKARISHRAQALSALVEHLRSVRI